MPALPSCLYFLGHFVPFLAITVAIALCLNPFLINDSFKSVNSPCCCLQNCLQVFGVFVLMECEECTQDSRCRVAYHIHCKGAQAEAQAQDTSTQPWSLLPSRLSLYQSLGCYISSLDSTFLDSALPPIDYLGF